MDVLEKRTSLSHAATLTPYPAVVQPIICSLWLLSYPGFCKAPLKFMLIKAGTQNLIDRTPGELDKDSM